jgi:hypothetical protein
MNKIRKLIIVFASIAILIAIAFVLVSNSVDSPDGKKNSVNAKKVKLLMDTAQVKGIMGRPLGITSYGYSIYNYNTPGTNSYGIFFEFDEQGILRKIERDDSVFYDTEYRDVIFSDGRNILDSIPSVRAGRCFKFE